MEWRGIIVLVFFLLPFYPNEGSGGGEMERMERLDSEPEERQTPQLTVSGSRPGEWMGTPQPGEVCEAFREMS